jgi:hypothetical protein
VEDRASLLSSSELSGDDDGEYAISGVSSDVEDVVALVTRGFVIGDLMVFVVLVSLVDLT